jgi:hypothetical protein
VDTEPAVVYYRSCSGITGWWLTPAEAAQLFADNACEGTLENGFAYYGATSGMTDLVGTAVTPHPIDSVPAEERAKLEARLAAPDAA